MFDLRAQRRAAFVQDALARLPASALVGTDADTVALRAEAFGIVPGQYYGPRGRRRAAAEATGWDPFIGTVTLVGFTFAPLYWADCDGSLLPISENDALFALIGTTYGGDGQDTFGLPDLRGRMPIGQGQGPGLSNRTIGEQSGAESITLTAAQLPLHTHGFVTAAAATTAATLGAVPAAVGAAEPARYAPTASGASMAATAAAGGSQPHANMPPYLALRMCISLFGIFPSPA